MLTSPQLPADPLLVRLIQVTEDYSYLQTYLDKLPGLRYQVHFGKETTAPNAEEDLVSLKEMIDSLKVEVSEDLSGQLGHVMDVITVNQTLAPIKTRSYQRGTETITENLYPLAVYPAFLNALETHGVRPHSFSFAD